MDDNENENDAEDSDDDGDEDDDDGVFRWLLINLERLDKVV